jgi:hypothetical protein
MDTPTPTDTPIPPGASINMGESSVGVVVEVKGSHWPAGQTIPIALSWAEQAPALIESRQLVPIGQAEVNGGGNFGTGVLVPGGQGWENGGQAAIVVYTSDYQYVIAMPLALIPPTPTPEPPPPPPPESPPDE